jgi:hypothetical protein
MPDPALPAGALRARFPLPEPDHSGAEAERPRGDENGLQSEIVWCESKGRLIDVSIDAPVEAASFGTGQHPMSSIGPSE